jgi:hypothetical protein
VHVQGPYEEGTRLICRKPVEIIVFKDDLPENHIIEPGTECVIAGGGLFPAVEITCPVLEATLRVRMPYDFDWREHFSILKYRHLIVVK